jgi:transcriptional regulator with XRE-family HTH domain
MKDRISLIIETYGITKSAFAEKIKVSPASVTQMCSGRINPSRQTIDLICREFRIREEWLRTGAGSMLVSDTERDKLQSFFADVLATAPDERSAFVAALADLPDAFWPLVAELARKYADNLKKED